MTPHTEKREATEMTEQVFGWLRATGNSFHVSGDGVPEGIFYPERPDLRQGTPEWREEALEAGRALWRMIGARPAWIVLRRGTGVKHALRNQPRGHGRLRREWQRTTECGQCYPHLTIPEGLPTDILAHTTCLMCRKVVRERYEDDLRYGFGDDGDRAADEYDWMRACAIQAEWHKPDPVALQARAHPSESPPPHSAPVGANGAAPSSECQYTYCYCSCSCQWDIPDDLNYSLLGG